MISRSYLKRAAGLLAGDTLVQVTPYLIKQGVIDGDGLYGDKEFTSFNELVTVAGWAKPEAEAFFARLQHILSLR